MPTKNQKKGDNSLLLKKLLLKQVSMLKLSKSFGKKKVDDELFMHKSTAAPLLKKKIVEIVK